MRLIRVNHHRFFTHTLVLVCLLIGMFAWSLPAQAQTNGSFFVFPSQNSIPLQSQLNIELKVSDVANVNAFDIVIEYDETLLDLDAWSYGNFLSNLFVVFSQNDPGYFRLACTQLATPAASGSGTLINLTFRAKAIGTTAIAILAADFSDSQGNLTSPASTNGSVQVTNASTYTPTSTKTTTPPPTSSPTNLPSTNTLVIPTLTSTAISTSTQVLPSLTHTPVSPSQISPLIPTIPPDSLTPTISASSPTAEPIGTLTPTAFSSDPTPTPIGFNDPARDSTPGGGVLLTKVSNRRVSEDLLWVLMIILILALLALTVVFLKRRQESKKKSGSD